MAKIEAAYKTLDALCQLIVCMIAARSFGTAGDGAALSALNLAARSSALIVSAHFHADS